MFSQVSVILFGMEALGQSMVVGGGGGLGQLVDNQRARWSTVLGEGVGGPRWIPPPPH